MPAFHSSEPGVVSMDAAEPSTSVNVAATGSRRTAMPRTLSTGRSIAVVPATGSVTSNPSIHSADSCGRVPLMFRRPSRPRTTPGSSGSDCRIRGRGIGRRWASGAVIVLPRCSMEAPAVVSADATTVVVALARASCNTTWLSAGRTWAVSKPSSETMMVSSESASAGKSYPPSRPVSSVRDELAAALDLHRTPGIGNPVWSTTMAWVWAASDRASTVGGQDRQCGDQEARSTAHGVRMS